ncbi:hypothetical protein HPB51_023817 [Rhipicephalus microplus]|uniref:Uncharacterized protein n=1 Tax=Rhipicephalus microplus TaxID=6941 RepID=A0A9J6ECU5_RHIMP|nr:hypothetical protein HPB51_023817 [Rhipicephalus microplus]
MRSRRDRVSNPPPRAYNNGATHIQNSWTSRVQRPHIGCRINDGAQKRREQSPASTLPCKMNKMADQLIYKLTGFIQKAKSYMPGACGEDNSGEQLHFAKQENDTELSNFQGLGTGSGEGGEFAETTLTEGVNGLGPQRSVDVVDEFGGREGEKISEWQAGWNVTNAIQPSGLLLRFKRKTLSTEMLPNTRQNGSSCVESLILRDHGSLQD